MPFKSLAQIITPADYKKGLAVDLRRLKANPKLHFVWVPAAKVLTVPGVLLIGHQKQDAVVDDLFKKQKITRWFAGSIHRNEADKVELTGSFKKRAVNKLINALHQTDLTDIVDWGDEPDDDGIAEESPSLPSPEKTPNPGLQPTRKDEPLVREENPSAPLPGTPPPLRPPPRPPTSETTSGKNTPPTPSFQRVPSEKSLGRESSVGSLFGRHREGGDGQKPPPPRVPPKPGSSGSIKPRTEEKEPDEDPALALEEAENRLAVARREAATFAKRIAAGRKLIAGVSKYSDKKYEKLGLADDFKRLDQLVSRPETLLATLGAELDRIQQDLKRAGKTKDGGGLDLANKSIAEARDLSRKVVVAARGLDNIAAGVKFVERTVKEAERLTKRLQAIDLKKVRDLKEGSGAEVKPGAKVKVNYKGWLSTGQDFDAGKDVEFGLDGVIQGWTLGIPGMKVGGIRKLVIAPDKGYGDRGSPPKIPGGATLIFEVEVVDVVVPPNVVTGPGRPMSDGSNGGTDDPGLSRTAGLSGGGMRGSRGGSFRSSSMGTSAMLDSSPSRPRAT